jgi:hypothetical protein
MTADVRTYSKEKYAEIEKTLADKINNLIESTEKEYGINTQIFLDSEIFTRVRVEVLNKYMFNLFMD